jgi:hypothetical protein
VLDVTAEDLPMPKDTQARPRPDRSETLLIEARAIVRGLAVPFLPKREQAQVEVRDARLQRHGEPRRRRHVADLLRAEEVDRRRREKDRRARKEIGGADEGGRADYKRRSGARWLTVAPKGSDVEFALIVGKHQPTQATGSA